MKRIIYLTNVIRRLGMMQQTLTRLQQEHTLDTSSWVRWIDNMTQWGPEWDRILKDADFVLVKWMGTGLDTAFMQRLVRTLKSLDKPYFVDALGGQSGYHYYGLTDAQEEQLLQYTNMGGEKNYYHLWQFINALNTAEEDKVPKPQELHWCGIFHPHATKVYTELEAYKKDFIDTAKPTVGILFYRDEWVWGDVSYTTALVEAIEAKGMNAICVFSNGLPQPDLGIPPLTEVFDRFFCEQGLPIIDVLMNIQKFSITSSKSMTLEYLAKWRIPVLIAYTIIAPYEEWKPSLEGMNAMEISISASLPEFDGVIHAAPVACKKILPNGSVCYTPIPERVERAVSKAYNWAKLHYKKKAETKVGIIFHNYPPRNSNIGSAVGLDSIESVRRLLGLLKENGYKVDTIPEDTKEFIEQLTRNATNDKSMLNERQLREANKVSGAEYQRFFDKMDPKVQEQLTKDWGEAPGQVMEFDGDLLVPGTMNGNVFVTVQPARGFGEDPSKIYHDPFTAPTHHYLAFYYWIREIWQADVVAHIGTHGNLEWLPGKQAGLDCTDYPDLALGDLVNIYPYHMTITGEGIQAKRRGAACLVDYLPAPQTRSGVYDELEELEKIMEEYLHFKVTQPENVDKLEALVLEKVAEANLQDEVVRDESEPFDKYIGELHNYITDLKNMEVHIGLHILGQPPVDNLLTEEILKLTRLENGEIPSMNQLMASRYGFDYYHLVEHSSEMYEPLGITKGMLIDKNAKEAQRMVEKLQEMDFSQEAVQEILAWDWVKAGGEEFLQRLEQLLNFICQEIYFKLQRTTDEMSSTLTGLEGYYVEPGPSGSPAAGGVDLLPTGRNFYGVDPRTLPTPSAWEIGKELGDQVINRFIEEEGHYPESVGMVMWSGSNMRSHGQCIAEFLWLMGIKPKYQSGSLRVCGLEVIPLEELKRPRVDVTSRISGMFRDSLPCVITLLDKAVLLAGSLEEPLDMNFVRKHILEDSRNLEETEHLPKEEAWRQAAYRVFGDALGCYGAGVAALLEAKNWETIDDIADVYVRWGGHAYGGKTKGQYMPQLFRRRMETLDITIKNEDNHETNMLSSDDYNAYHGGMIAAVRSIKGSAPRSYCGDSTDRSRVKLHSVQEEAKRLFRSEAINPKFIKGMMEHGYKGAADMANMIAHSFQWDATSAVMEDWMYEKYAEKYTFDKEVQEWLREVNPWALQRMTEVLLEAEQRGLWNAKPETKEQLQELYLSMEGELEERSDED